MLAVCDDAGTMVDLLLDATQAENVSQKQSALQLLAVFCTHTKADYSSYVPKLLHGIIYQFKDQDEKNLQLAWEALNAVCKVFLYLIYFNLVHVHGLYVFFYLL